MPILSWFRRDSRDTDSGPGATPPFGSAAHRVCCWFPPCRRSAILSLSERVSRDTDSGPDATPPFGHVSHTVCCGFPPRRGTPTVSCGWWDSHDTDSGPCTTPCFGHALHTVSCCFPPSSGYIEVFLASGGQSRHGFRTWCDPARWACSAQSRLLCPSLCGYADRFLASAGPSQQRFRIRGGTSVRKQSDSRRWSRLRLQDLRGMTTE